MPTPRAVPADDPLACRRRDPHSAAHPGPRGPAPRRPALVASTACLTLALALAACGDDAGQAPAPTGPASLALASLSSSDFQQCANGTSGTAPCDWINSVLNASKSAYVEGEVIPFRLAVHLTDGSGAPFSTTRVREVTFEYGFEKSATPHFNYDFLAKYNSSESQANVCSGPLAPVKTYCDAQGNLKAPYANAGEHHAFPMPVPGTPSQVQSVWNITKTVADARQAFEAAGGKAEFDIWGGVITGVDDVVYTASGDDITARVTVRFRANRPDVLLAWGAHFSRGADWGTGFGASGQSGSPFHVKMVSIDGTGAGALGNNVSGAVVTLPSLTLAKTGTATPVSAGDNVSYTVAVTNGASGGTASGVTITDNLPPLGTDWSIQSQAPSGACTITGAPGSETLTCGPVSLAPGASLTATLTSATTAASCPSLTNTASATATGTTVTGSPTAGVVITVNCPSVTLTKTTPSPTVNAGTDVAFTVQVSNAGPGDARNVAVSDNLPSVPAGLVWSVDGATPAGWTLSGNTLSYAATTLAAGASSSITVKSATTASTCGTVSNQATATMSFGTVTGSPANAQAFINCAGLSIVKKTNGTDNNSAPGPFIKVGDPVTWTYAVTNTGNVALTNVVVTDDRLAATAISCTGTPGGSNVIPTLAANGGTATCTASGTAAAGQYTNTGTATVGGTSASDPDNYFGAAPSVAIQKKTNGTDNNTAPGASVAVGSSVTWTYAVYNTGNVALTNVTVADDNGTPASAADDITPSCTGTPGGSNVIATLAVGATATCTATGTATAGQYTNTGTVTASSAAGSPPPATDPDNYFGANPQLSIVKKTNGTDNNSAPGASVSVGTTVTWTYGVTNTGNVPLTNVVVTDDNGTAGNTADDVAVGTIASLAVGASAQPLSATGTAVAGQYTNVGTAAATYNGAAVSATDPDNYFGHAPALTITKTPDNGSVVAGNTATFTIVVRNTGQGDAFNVALSDQLLHTLTWSVGSSSGWTTTPCSISTAQLLTCGVATLSAGASATVAVSANVPTGFVYQPPAANGTQLEIDGNLVSDGGTDWANAGISCAIPTGCALDATGATDNSFGNGTKEDTPVPSITDGSIPPNKSDLLRFYVQNNRVAAVNGAVHDFVYLAWERVLDPQGTTNMDFEFNQSTQVTANGETPARTAGDILIKYDLSKGGGSLTMGYHKWITSGVCEANGQAPPCWGKAQSLAGSFLGKANDFGSVVDPLAPNNPRTLSTLTFGEASINLTTSGIFTAGQCTSFGRAYLKSRSSDSFTSAIKDFVTPIPVSITNCQPASIPNTASVSASNATGSSDAGQITVTVP